MSVDPPGMTWSDRAPVCGCGKRLPNFAAGSADVDDGDPSGFIITATTFHVRCACGATWDLKKVCDQRPTHALPQEKKR